MLFYVSQASELDTDGLENTNGQSQLVKINTQNQGNTMLTQNH
jgi:hypothetical protein